MALPWQPASPRLPWEPGGGMRSSAPGSSARGGGPAPRLSAPPPPQQQLPAEGPRGLRGSGGSRRFGAFWGSEPCRLRGWCAPRVLVSGVWGLSRSSWAGQREPKFLPVHPQRHQEPV